MYNLKHGNHHNFQLPFADSKHAEVNTQTTNTNSLTPSLMLFTCANTSSSVMSRCLTTSLEFMADRAAFPRLLLKRTLREMRQHSNY